MKNQNFIEITISKKEALLRTKSFIQKVELFMLQNKLAVTKEQLNELHDDFAENIIKQGFLIME